MRKPIVYIASPYSNGDVAVNAHFQCKVFDQILTEGKALPVAPLWTHFQHLLFPRPYEDWIAYDQAMLPLYDCCLRLSARMDHMVYEQTASSGADAEVAAFVAMGKPVFYALADLYDWIDSQQKA